MDWKLESRQADWVEEPKSLSCTQEAEHKGVPLYSRVQSLVLTNAAHDVSGACVCAAVVGGPGFEFWLESNGHCTSHCVGRASGSRGQAPNAFLHP